MKKNHLFLILIIIISGVCILYFNYKKDSNKGSVISIYKDNASVVLNSRYYSSTTGPMKTKDEFIKNYKCKNDKCKFFTFVGDNVVILDGSYYIYNFINEKKNKIDLGNKRYQEIRINELNNKIVGLEVKKGDKCAFYSLDENEFITDFKYNSTWVYEINMYKNGHIFASKEAKDEFNYLFYVLDIKTGNVLLGDVKSNIEPLVYKDFLYYLTNRDEKDMVNIYNNKLELLFDGNKYNLYQIAIDNDGSLVLNNKKAKSFNKYDNAGKLLYESKAYKDISMIKDGYAIVVDNDNYLKIVDYNGKVVVSFINFKNNLKLHIPTSNVSENDVNLIIQNKNIKKGNKGYCQGYNYNFITKEKSVKEADLCNAG